MRTQPSLPVLIATCFLAGSPSAQEPTLQRGIEITSELAGGVLDVRPTIVAIQRPAAVSASRTFVLEAGEHAILELIDRAATWLGRNYLSSVPEMQTTATIRLQTELQIPTDDVGAVLGQLLFSVGYAVVPLNEELGIFEVIHMQGPRRGELAARARQIEPDAVLGTENGMDVVATVVTLEHINAQLATNSLRPFFSSGAQSTALIIGSAGDQNSILLQGFRPQIAAAIRLLRQTDEAAGRAADRQRVQTLEQRLEQLEQGSGNRPQMQGMR